jgi:hypothetical protein
MPFVGKDVRECSYRSITTENENLGRMLRRRVDLLYISRALRPMHKYLEYLFDSWITERRSGCTVSHDRAAVNDELETKWKEAVKMSSIQLSFPGQAKEKKDTQIFGRDSRKKKNIAAATPKCPFVYYWRIQLNPLRTEFLNKFI